MGTAHLLGQLRLPSDPFTALPLLRQAYETATIDFPQPAYVYGMLLAGELVTTIAISPSLVLPHNSPLPSPFSHNRHYPEKPSNEPHTSAFLQLHTSAASSSSMPTSDAFTILL